MRFFVEFATLRQMVARSALIGAALLCAFSSAHAGRFEAGSFTAHDTSANGNPVRVNFQQTFDTVPIVVALIGNTGTDAAKIRITNVTTTGFDELILEPDDFDGPHSAETIHYLAVEPGRHVLPGGGIVEAGTETVSAIQHGSGVGGAESWANPTYSASLPAIPGVIAHIQTANNEPLASGSSPSQPFLTATTRNLTASGFDLALERSEASAGSIVASETIGWIAFPAGSSGSFLDVSNASVTWSGVNTASNIRGWNNGCFSNPFGLTSASAIVIAKKNSHFGGDGGWIRRCSLSSSAIGLTVDEDTSRDNERGHIVESTSIIAFSRAFHALLSPSMSVTKTSVSFTDQLGSSFALPQAQIEYLISVQNAGNSPPNYDSIALVEALPSQVALVVTDFGAPASGPVQYLDGSPATGLTCSFAGFASTTDCYSFSTDGTDFTYQPTDSGDGTDPLVSHVRIVPSGFMQADGVTSPTAFTLRFHAKIK
ncbi:hypothetical protein [Parasphingorhabdus sp.]